MDFCIVEQGPVRIEYSSIGSGPPVVLLPGRGGSGDDQYANLGARLVEAGYRAVSMNPRGVRDSRGPLDDITLHDLADDVALITRFFDEPAHIVGRAFGNRIARCVASDHPSHVKSVTLLAAGGLVPPPKAQQLPPSPKATPRSSGKRRQWQYRTWNLAGVAQSRAAEHTPLDDWWAGGEAPILVIQGLDDRIAVPENGRALARTHPDRVTLCEFANAGHGILFEKPKRVAREIVAFLDSIEQRNSR